ncbi:ras and Rab interactor 3 [Salmo salar]|uniref:Ras and Rab interactor 3 n=1 Tax=Salmo salar TaxID=8030 RepID=A0A1S3SR17_SALSA|nr:ras and Rab interactor 3 [Salmo salar]|eukprot:XP_014066787.1 PREDICTED: ras and Rab interactor 3-like isoform X1 [Salmo salar]
MMKTAVLSQETGASTGVNAEPRSPPRPLLTPTLSSGSTALFPPPRPALSPGPPLMAPPTLHSKPSPHPDPTPSPPPVYLDSFSLLPSPLIPFSPSSPTPPLHSASEPLPSQIDLAIDATDTTDVPDAAVPKECIPPLSRPLVLDVPDISTSTLVTSLPPQVLETSTPPLPTPQVPDVPETSTPPLPTPVPPQVSEPSTLPLPDILDVSAPPLPLHMSSSVPELSSSELTLPAPSSQPVPKPSSMLISSPTVTPISKPSSLPISSPHVPPIAKPPLSTPPIPPLSKPSVPPSPRVPPFSKISSPPLPRPSAPRKLSGPPQPRPPVPHPHSIAKPSSPALPRPPLPSMKSSSPPLPSPLVPLAPKPAPASASSPAPSPTQATAPRASISILEKLIKTCPVWLQLGMAQERTTLILKKEIPGIFLVRKSPDQKSMVLSVGVSDKQEELQVQDVLIKEEKSLIYLEGSVLVFDNIFKLIAFYCVSRDILPFTLRLPQVIVQATKYEDIEMISTLGSDFWGSQLHSSSEMVKREDPGQGHSSSSCEIQLSTGNSNDRLWYINPIFIKEYCSSLEASTLVPAPIHRNQSLNTPGPGQVQVPPKFKRPPPRPPNVPEGLILSQGAKQGARGESVSPRSPPPPRTVIAKAAGQKAEGDSSKDTEEGEGAASQLVSEKEVSVTVTDSVAATQPLQPLSSRGATAGQKHPAPRPPPHRIPLVPLRRKPSENRPSIPGQEAGVGPVPVASLVCIDDTTNMAEEKLGVESHACETETLQNKGTSGASNISEVVTVATAPLTKRATHPVPPPRKKKPSQFTPTRPLSRNMISGGLLSINSSSDTHQNSSTPSPASRPTSFPVREARGTDVSLYSPDGEAVFPALEHDSYSTSSTEEEADTVASGAVGTGGTNNTKVSMKRTPTIMLDRAKHRFSSVFTNFMNTDHKLQKRILELSRDGSSYFGTLVKDYRLYILETMGKHSSSTELLQEIRQMMTQLKSYLIQSTELQNLLEPNIYTEDKLEVIIEAAMCKAMLKPLREAVYSGLKDIHARDGCLKRLRVNQSVVLGTTTTELGITTSVPETPVMEKIQLKLTTLHQEYSPQKKIDLLLKTCKIIYESMSIGCPAGRAHGADDFLPVLMYVLARSNMAFLLLDVEYMMELMDPALQLGEGSYYLTTTYGVLEHIKNYEKQVVTQKLSLEIQNSIHRWEKRRTLNKASVSRSSVQGFINVSFLEAGCNTKTMRVCPNTTAQDLCAQCADKFEVAEPESYSLSVLVEGHHQLLAPEEFPLTIKSSLHHSQPLKEYYIVYRPGRTESEGQESEGQESEGQESEGQESESQESESQESESQEAESQEAESQEAESQEAEGQEAEGQEVESEQPAPAAEPEPEEEESLIEI